jgi:hypothetical protein
MRCLPSDISSAAIRLVEFQDWHTPPPSSDDNFNYGAGDEEDSDDSNYNGFHPGFSGGGGARPRTTRFAGGDEPRLGRGSGPAFRAQDTRQLILVGNETCPVISPCGTTPCSRSVSGVSATHGPDYLFGGGPCD